MSDSEEWAVSSLSGPRGVGGWLLFLIVTMLFVGPLAYVNSLLRSYHSAIENFARVPHPYAHSLFIVVEQLAGLALYGYGVFAGVQLWKKRPSAVMHAKRFLLLYAAYHLADFAMGMNFASIMDPAGTLRRYLSRQLPSQGRLLVYPIVWYLYLLRSKRVRNTFLSETKQPDE